MASDFAIRHAVHIINRGGIIAYPTDTIYGLGCDPYNPDAVKKINAIKQRPLNKQFILLAANINQLRPLILIKKEQEKIITQNTQVTSWIVKASPTAPPWLVGDSKTLCIRISKHDEVQRLCNTLGHAIISTSANLAGKKTAKNALQLHKYFHQYVEIILIANKNPGRKASKIIRLCDNQVIRD
ncbi:MAG: L-threonylcarbamoyladenylate synthase [Gammaproteobacteria bacterium]